MLLTGLFCPTPSKPKRWDETPRFAAKQGDGKIGLKSSRRSQGNLRTAQAPQLQDSAHFKGHKCAYLRTPSALRSAARTRPSWLGSAWTRCSWLRVPAKQLRQASYCSGCLLPGGRERLKKTLIREGKWSAFYPWFLKKPDIFQLFHLN